MDTPIGQFLLIGNFRRRLAREQLVIFGAFSLKGKVNGMFLYNQRPLIWIETPLHFQA